MVPALPVETDEELVWWLQEKEVVVEEAWLGRDTATLEVVMEAAGPLMRGQLGGLGALAEELMVHLRWLGRASHPWLWRFSHPWW